MLIKWGPQPKVIKDLKREVDLAPVHHHTSMGGSITTHLPPPQGKEGHGPTVLPKQGPPVEHSSAESHPGQESEEVRAGSLAPDTWMTERKLRSSVSFYASLAGKSTLIRTSSCEGWEKGKHYQSRKQPSRKSGGPGARPRVTRTDGLPGPRQDRASQEESRHLPEYGSHVSLELWLRNKIQTRTKNPALQ